MIENNWNGYFGFNDADLYRAFMPDWSYHWGSNRPKAHYGNLNNLLIKYNINPSQQPNYVKYRNEVAHYFHGVNPLGIVYMSNMNDYGAEKSCNEIYHTWFANGTDWDNALTSLYGPAPGFVSGGPNHQYNIVVNTPPSGQPDQKCYLDFNTSWPENSWEITEPAIYYQAAYIRLLANFVDTMSLSNTENINVSSSLIEVFPNPTSHFFTIKGQLSDYYIDLLNVSGQVVQSIDTVALEVVVNMSNLPSGLFFIRLRHKTSNKLSLQKIIKE